MGSVERSGVGCVERSGVECEDKSGVWMVEWIGGVWIGVGCGWGSGFGVCG